MKIWNPGDTCQIRDRRDGTIVFTATVREQRTEKPLFDGGENRIVVYVTPDDPKWRSCGIPHICIEEVGQAAPNGR